MNLYYVDSVGRVVDSAQFIVGGSNPNNITEISFYDHFDAINDSLSYIKIISKEHIGNFTSYFKQAISSK